MHCWKPYGWRAIALFIAYQFINTQANSISSFISIPLGTQNTRTFRTLIDSLRANQAQTCLMHGINIPGRLTRIKRLVTVMARSQETDEIVFVPGQTSKSQPRRGTGSRWEQWFGASEEMNGEGSKSSEGIENAAADHTQGEPGKAVDNLRRLQAATYNSLDWKVRNRTKNVKRSVVSAYSQQ